MWSLSVRLSHNSKFHSKTQSAHFFRVVRPNDADENFAMLQQQIYFNSYLIFAKQVEGLINSFPTKLYANQIIKLCNMPHLQ